VSAHVPAARAGDRRLAATIEAGLLSRGCTVRVLELSRRPSPYASTARLEEVDVLLADGRRVRLMFKDLRPGAVLDAARDVRPAVLRDPAREPLVYARLLDHAPAGPPACVSAVADASTGRHHVVLERVAGLQLCHVGDITAWEEAARWLARLHIRLRHRAADAVARGEVPLLVLDAAFHRAWMARARARVRARESDTARRRAFERLADGHEELVARLTALPGAFLHGECYPSNVLVRDERRDAPICPVDWEMAALGPGALDLAALTSGDWPAPDRRRLVEAYRRTLRDEGGEAPALAELEVDVECCRLQLAVQLLAWGPAWTPPGPHARDWLGEALRLGERCIR
jgi:Ser/Thr protein kinase RdoA (MazF antagonist)